MADSNEEAAGTKTPDSPGPGDLGRSSRRHLLTVIGTIGVSASLAGSVSADEDDTGPTIDSLVLTDNSNPPWIWYHTNWDVSSEDGTLRTVRTELLNDGTIVASEETSVNRSTAFGEHRVRTRDDADVVRFIVVDADGRLRGRTFEVEGANLGEEDDSTTGDNSTDDNTTVEGNETTDDDTTDSSGGPTAGETPGPGMLGTLASIGGAGYLLSRTSRDDVE